MVVHHILIFLYRMKDIVTRFHSSLSVHHVSTISKSKIKNRRTFRNSSTHRDDLSRQRSHANDPHTNVVRRLAWLNDCECLSVDKFSSLETDLAPHHANRSVRLFLCIHQPKQQAIGLDLTLTRTQQSLSRAASWDDYRHEQQRDTLDE